MYVVFCVLVKKTKYPGPDMRETTRRSDGHEWFKRSAGGVLSEVDTAYNPTNQPPKHNLKQTISLHGFSQ